ncbi:MAG: OmpH family outer membrane protein [Acidobacteriota bacterium]
MFQSTSPLVRLMIALLFVGFLAAGTASAQDMKIAVINTEKVLLESQTGKTALDELRTLTDSKQKEGETKQKELEELRKRLADGALSLSEDKLAELQRQAEDLTIELRRFQDDANRDLNKRREEILADIDRKVMPIITAYGKEQGLTMIFRKFESGLIFASEQVDITDAVIQRLDSGS